MIEISLNEDQKKDFQKNGFLIIESFLDTTHFERLYERFHSLFNGNFETGIEQTSGIGSLKVDPKMLLDKFVMHGNQIIQLRK